jgi:type I restriction enzyme M protein
VTLASNSGIEPLGIEDVLWKAADKLRGSMDASEYKHVVLGLIFLKYVSEAFLERQNALEQALTDPSSPEYLPNPEARKIILESRDEYTAQGIFWVPEGARWPALQADAKQPDIGRRIDAAMDAVEGENSSLLGVLPKNFARPSLDTRRLGELVDLVGSIGLRNNEQPERDILGRVYEYFLGRFASSEGKGGGEFYTPRSVVRLLVDMLEPYAGRVYDPCCGSGGMFVQADRFVREHGGKRDEISVYGQELNDTTWRLARMNLAIRGIEANLGPEWGDTFHDDKHPDLRADFVLANPPFNVSDWGGELLHDDPRWKFGIPSASNANYAWLQHIVSKLSPRGIAGVVLANGSMSSQQVGEDSIRRSLIERDLVECMVALPTQLFYNTGIPACLWFLNRDKTSGATRNWRDRRGQVLFIDARRLGTMVTRVHRDFSNQDIRRIADIYHAWRGEPEMEPYSNIPGFCASTTLKEIAEHAYILTPGRYVGAEDVDEDDEPIGDKLKRLTKQVIDDFDESSRLEAQIRARLTDVQLNG